MSDMHVIGQIEKKLGQSLKRISMAEIEKADYTHKKAYAIDEDNNVTGLWLDGYTVSLIPEISGLTQLSALNLRHGLFENLDFLQKLTNLTSLDLFNANITDISVLKELKGLTSLDLTSNNITDVSVLKELKGLTSLDLSGTNITDVSVLKELKGLTSLDLSGTNITDVSVLKELKGLISLDLSGTKITDVSVLKELKGLTFLVLSGTSITDVSVLKELKGLTFLSLRNNTNITDFSVLKELKGLTSLDLTSNKITDVSVLKELKGLTSLDLSGTKITDVLFIVNLPCLKKIYLDKIETLGEPPQQVINEGINAIRNYFHQKSEQGSGYLYEAKVLIVGEPGSGKTSLRKKLVDPGYKVPNKETSTLGVEVQKDWDFPFSPDKDVVFNANIWDFGGQDIQYMIHQYFLTGKSLYIMVADERKQNTHYEYWFNIIQLLGEGSPVLVVVLNKRDGVAITSYDHSEICKAFPKLRIEQFELDMAKEQNAFMALREKIQTLLCNLPHSAYAHYSS